MLWILCEAAQHFKQTIMPKSTKINEPLEPGESALPAGVVPEGTDADVTVRFRKRIVPPAPAQDDERDDLSDAALLADEDLAPGDQLDQFLEQWANFRGYNCEVVRLPDPADRRMIGNQYPKPNFGEVERLGGIPFDPLTLVSTLQMINGNSGGIFRIWLTDQTGARIPGASLYRVAIGNPPGSQHIDPRLAPPPPAPAPAAPPPPPRKSEMEQRLESIQSRLLETALDRALNPPAPPPAPAPQVSDEDRLGMMLLTRSDLLSTVVGKLTAAVNAGDAAGAGGNTWRDKLVDYVTQNPQVGLQIAGTAERVVIGLTSLVSQILPGAPAQTVPVPPPTQHAPQATPAAAANPGAPVADDVIDADSGEDEDMAILDELFTLLNDTREITGNDPVFQQLQRDYPIKFRMVVRMIASASEADIIAYVSEQSPLYKSLLESPVTGAHLTQRLGIVRQICIAAVTPQAQPQPVPASEPLPEPPPAPQPPPAKRTRRKSSTE